MFHVKFNSLECSCHRYSLLLNNKTWKSNQILSECILFGPFCGGFAEKNIVKLSPKFPNNQKIRNIRFYLRWNLNRHKTISWTHRCECYQRNWKQPKSRRDLTVGTGTCAQYEMERVSNCVLLSLVTVNYEIDSSINKVVVTSTNQIKAHRVRYWKRVNANCARTAFDNGEIFPNSWNKAFALDKKAITFASQLIISDKCSSWQIDALVKWNCFIKN